MSLHVGQFSMQIPALSGSLLAANQQSGGTLGPPWRGRFGTGRSPQAGRRGPVGVILVAVRAKYGRCGRAPSLNSSCDPVVFEEVQPEAHGTIDDVDEKDRLAVE